MKKPRADSLFAKLDPEQRANLEAWLFDEGLGYAAAVQRLREAGVATSVGGVQNFYQERAQARLLDRIGAARTLCSGIETGLREAAPALEERTLQLISQHAFELAVNQQGDLKALARLVKLMLEARRQATAEKSLGLDLQKYQDQVAERKAAIEKELAGARSKGGITPETMEKIERELKLL